MEAGGTTLKGDGVGVGAGVSMADTGAAGVSGGTVIVRGGFAGSGLACAGVCSAGVGATACSVCLEHAAIKHTEITANILFIIYTLPVRKLNRHPDIDHGQVLLFEY